MQAIISNILHSFTYLMSSNASYIKLHIFIVTYFKYITKSHCIFFKFCNNYAIDICIFVKVILSFFSIVKKKLESLEKLLVVKIHFSSTYFQPEINSPFHHLLMSLQLLANLVKICILL